MNQILPVAPDIPIQIVHLGGSGPNYDGEEALKVFVDAINARNPQMKNIYFEVSSEVTQETPQATLELVAKRIRQLGLQRVVYGSDRAGTRDDRSKSGNWDWSAFKRLPLTKEEFRIIANNVALTCTRRIIPKEWRESNKLKTGDSCYEKDFYGRANRRHLTRL